MSFPENFVEVVKTGTSEECTNILSDFNTRNDKAKDFPGVKLDVKIELWEGIKTRLESQSTPPELIRLLLWTLRILSREKTTIERLVDDRLINILLKIAGLKETTDYQNCGFPETLESLKVIFNMIFQSQTIQASLITNRLLEGLMDAIRDFRSSSAPSEVKYFTMRVLFVITALSQHTGPRVRSELKGVVYITDFLEEQTKLAEPYDDMTADVISESLKVLYNIIHDIVPNKNDVHAGRIIDEEDLKYLLKITQLVRKFLLHPTNSEEKKHELNGHSIDLLNAVSSECFDELIPKGTNSQFQLEDHDMAAIEAIANFLHYRLDRMEDTRLPAQCLSPILCVLLRLVESHRLIRKYLKRRILPPLKKTDIVERPEVGSTLRNKLCALLTSPAGNITDIVASLLFIICKENVRRMVKYTGYGNAAGLLANRGLLLGGRGRSQDYSSESDDSDTEEYREVRHLINDVEGWLQPERPPPCQGMTDEQKEYEAIKLVQAIDKLNRSSIIQPCRVSADGRPEPIEHVLQLQESAQQSRDHNHDSESDED